MGSALDAVVVGGGIVGLATARALLLDRPGSAVVVLEKESAPALHQSGRNSGVIHSGIYYPPGSLKARLCAAGRRSIETYARDHGIPVEITGKLIVATRIEEIGDGHRVDLDDVANMADVHLFASHGRRAALGEQ